MIRRVVHATVVCCSLLSLLCFAATVALWVRSCVKPEHWDQRGWLRTPPTGYADYYRMVGSDDGRIYVSDLVVTHVRPPPSSAPGLGWTHTASERPRIGWMELRTLWGYGRSDIGRVMNRNHEDSLAALDRAHPLEPWQWNQLTNVEKQRAYHLFNALGYVVSIPIWPFAVVTLLGGTPILWSLARRCIPVRAPGLCRKCGYDLRSIQSDRCPECGTALLTYRELARR
jgi:hypothetical protein